MSILRTALDKVIAGPKVGQLQRYDGGLIPDLGRFPYFGGVPFGGSGGVDAYVTMLAQDAYEKVGAVGAVIAVRLHVYSEITFCWQVSKLNGPRNLFGTTELELLETPWEGASTPDLLNVMELDSSLAGNCYLVRERMTVRNGDRLTRLDPTKVKILTEDVGEPLNGRPYGKYLVGYAYIEKMGAELKERTRLCELLVIESNTALEQITETAAQFRDAGKAIFLRIEDCSALTREVRATCDALKQKIAVPSS